MPTYSINNTINPGDSEDATKAMANWIGLLNNINRSGGGGLDGDNLTAAAAAQLGLSDTIGPAVRRGAVNIAASESTSSTTYTTLTTPDRVSNVVLPTNGLIAVLYEAMWQQSAAAAGRAAIFLGANQIQVQGYNGTTFGAQSQAAATGGGAGSVNANAPLFSFSGGLASGQPGVGGFGADVTTGQIVGFNTTAAAGAVGSASVEVGGIAPTTTASAALGGACFLFAAAGTYTVSIQFKATSGSVTASNRRLWVFTLGF